MLWNFPDRVQLPLGSYQDQSLFPSLDHMAQVLHWKVAPESHQLATAKQWFCISDCHQLVPWRISFLLFLLPFSEKQLVCFTSSQLLPEDWTHSFLQTAWRPVFKLLWLRWLGRKNQLYLFGSGVALLPTGHHVSLYLKQPYRTRSPRGSAATESWCVSASLWVCFGLSEPQQH